MVQPDLSWLPPPEELAARYRELRRTQRDGHVRWILLLKELRVLHGVSILEAERIALQDPARRRWVEKQINSDQRCRKSALAHIRYNGVESLIERDGETFNFRIRAA